MFKCYKSNKTLFLYGTQRRRKIMKIVNRIFQIFSSFIVLLIIFLIVLQLTGNFNVSIFLSILYFLSVIYIFIFKKSDLKKLSFFNEIAISLGILNILAIIIIIPIPRGYSKEAKIAKTLQSLDSIVNATIRYNALEDKTLNKLVELNKKYLVEIPKDEWDRDIKLDTKVGRIYSAGPDRKYGTEDDLIKRYLSDPMLLSVKIYKNYLKLIFSKQIYIWNEKEERLIYDQRYKNSKLNFEKAFRFFEYNQNENEITKEVISFGKSSEISVNQNVIRVFFSNDTNIKSNLIKMNLKSQNLMNAFITDVSREEKFNCRVAIRSGSKIILK